jgi:hypothetical protein
MATMQICYKDKTTGQYVCETRNVSSAAMMMQRDTTTGVQADTATTKGKPDKAAIQDKAMQLIKDFLQDRPDYFTITYVAADE